MVQIVQKTLDDYKEFKGKDDALRAVEIIVRLEYLPLLGRLEYIKQKVFEKLEKAGLIGRNEVKTYAVSLPEINVYFEQYWYSNTALSDASKMRVNSIEKLEEFREKVIGANQKVMKNLPEGTPTKLYFGVIRKAAKLGDENAKKALNELTSKKLVEVKLFESIDTRNVDLVKLVGEAKKWTEAVQEKLDIYADKDFAASYIQYLAKRYVDVYFRLQEKKKEIFDLIKEYNLLGSPSSIKIKSEYGTVYLGVYDEIEYRGANERQIKEILFKYGFRSEEFVAIDIGKIMRSEKYKEVRDQLSNSGYINPEIIKRARIIGAKEDFKNLKR